MFLLPLHSRRSFTKQMSILTKEFWIILDLKAMWTHGLSMLSGILRPSLICWSLKSRSGSPTKALQPLQHPNGWNNWTIGKQKAWDFLQQPWMTSMERRDVARVNILQVSKATDGIFYKPGVAGAVLQTSLWLINWVSDSLFVKIWNFERMFTPHHVSDVMGHV